MRKIRWQWQLSMLLIAIQLARPEEHNNDDSDSGRFFTQIYKRNLKQLVELRNTTVEPCENFYAHACGNFDRFMARADADDALPPYLYNRQDRMEFFQSQHVNFQTMPGKLLSQLYGECRARGMSARSPGAHWERLRQQLPFWPSTRRCSCPGPFASSVATSAVGRAT